jgi:hypothetical protein
MEYACEKPSICFSGRATLRKLSKRVSASAARYVLTRANIAPPSIRGRQNADYLVRRDPCNPTGAA